MASKKFCDRCGREIEPCKRGWMKRHVYFGEIFLDPWTPTEEESYDLCPECVTSFRFWMETGKDTPD